MKGSFKIDARRWNSAVRQLAAVPRSKPLQQVMRTAAGQVIRRVVSVTPPSKGDANKQSQSRGESAVVSDLLKIAVPTEIASAGNGRDQSGRFLKHSDLLSSFTELLAVYKASRLNSNGRVNPRNRKQQLHVSQADFAKLTKQLQKLVGTLAAGWNTAAEILGIRLPAWIKRHGTKYGEIRITLTDHGIRIYLANKVGFVDNIPDLRRRLQWALNTVGKSIIEKQIPAAVKNAGKRAGFKVR